jgi:hypothetical protein
MGVRENFDYDKLRLLDDQLVDEHLTSDEVAALVAHLTTNVEVFRSRVDEGFIDEEQLRVLLARSLVTTLEPKTTHNGMLPQRTMSTRATASIPESKRQRQWMFHFSQVATKCVIVLSGKVVVLAGKDEWRSEVGMFAVLGQNCLTSREDYRPDFCAHVAEEKVRCLYLQKSVFAPALSGVRSLNRRTNAVGKQQTSEGLPIDKQLSRVRGLSDGSSGDPSPLQREGTLRLQL